MPKKTVKYIRYCYCTICQEEFSLSSWEEMACSYCKNKNSFVILSEKEETEQEIIETFKKDISICKKVIQEAYLEGSFQKSEKEDLERLKELKDMENFFKRNPNPDTEEVLKIIEKKVIRNHGRE